ncbi:MAG: DUF1385 domain-containing protein [Armatimonadetes bacterium]|nr:DUF1385 domain-containing protein [Armatimonadota bacterium]
MAEASKPQCEAPAYGGQAVVEGVMIRSPRYVSVACRLPQPDGSHGVSTPIDVHTELVATPYNKRPWLRRVPLLRGIISLFEMLGLGLRCLERSANLQLAVSLLAPWLFLTTEPDEPAGPPPKDAGALNGPMLWGTIGVSVLIGMGLFVVLPHALAQWLTRLISSDSNVVLNLIEGAVRLLVFVGYVGLIGLMPDIRRVFAYHGAEHKVVNAWEASDPANPRDLTVDEVMPNSVIHPRCGTNFAFIVIMMSIVLFIFLPRPSFFLWRILLRLAAMPLVAGLSFELLKLVGRFRSATALQVLIAPGLAMQRITTRQPSSDMVEVALASFHAVRRAEETGELTCLRTPATETV